MQAPKNIYIDIDGVLLANEQYAARHANEFLQFIIKHYTVYWLTAHCQGDASIPIRRFGHLFSLETQALLPQIRPTKWTEVKTEAIDFETPFFWFDDDLFERERQELAAHHVVSSWVEIDLAKDPEALRGAIGLLKSLS